MKDLENFEKLSYLLTSKIWHLGALHSVSSSHGRYIPSVTQLIRITKMLILSNHVFWSKQYLKLRKILFWKYFYT